MQSGSIGSSATTTALGGAGRNAASLRSEDFYRMLVTELQNQDPLEPSKTSDMINQVSQIRGIELSQELSGTLGRVADQQRASGVGDMLGKFVVAQVAQPDGTSRDVRGVVTSARFNTDGSAVLELDSGEAVRLTDVRQVTTVDHAQRLSAA